MNYSLPDHVSQRMIFFVHREYRRIGYFRIHFFDNSKIQNVIISSIDRTLQSNEPDHTHFFSPSYNKNDSNVGGAFISTTKYQFTGLDVTEKNIYHRNKKIKRLRNYFSSFTRLCRTFRRFSARSRFYQTQSCCCCCYDNRYDKDF